MNDKFLLTIGLAITVSIVTTFGQCRAEETKAGPRPEPAAVANRRIDFIKDVQPLFQKACLPCHGLDKQKGDYRLDVRETALKGGESHAPNILPGKSDQSPLIGFVVGTGDLVMPPEGQRLAANEIEVLRAWIDQGAHWPDEVAGKRRDKSDLWSVKPLVRPEIPGNPILGGGPNQTSAIDAFIRSELAEHNFAPSPEADRRTLIRRVSYDLIGLPPTPEEVENFVGDADPQAYTKLVDRLLESPRYGERWARHWLDMAHFAETHGHDQDRIREHAWPYRDYLIRSFNSDSPYYRFVQEQVAGDILFPEDSATTAALGFLAAGPWDESSLRDIREDTIDRQIARYLDRDDMVATVMNNICSVTVQCARCHDHKFDPISQPDYYALQAVFSGVERANRRYDLDPNVHRQRRELTQRQRDIERRSIEEVARLMSDDVQQSVTLWERNLPNQTGTWHLVNIESFASSEGAALTRLSDGSILSGGPRPDKDTVTILTAPLESILGNSQRQTPEANEKRMVRITAIQLEVLTDESLPRSGPGRQDNGNLHLSEFEVYVEGRDKPIGLANPTADFNQNGWEIAKSIDQIESTAWGIDPQEGSAHRAVFELKEPLRWDNTESDPSGLSAKASELQRLGPKERLRFVLKQLHGRGHLIGRMRISVTDSAPPIRVDGTPAAITSILATPQSQRTDAQRLELAVFQQMEEVNRGLSALPPSSLVYAAAADFEPDGSLRPPPGPRPIHVLHRGDIRQPREEATPGALTCIKAAPARFTIPAGAPESERRAALAKWLTDKNNPLTWRSIVNRVWHHHFGRGIVGTLNDFGHMGETPSHPELLDWLAVEFRDGGQSLKQLHRLILTSETYRQKVDPRTSKNESSGDLSTTDPRSVFDADNRLLWRMNRTRLDAESIRDSVLAISARLDLRMGGPSDRQFDLQPGIHVTPRVDYGKFDPSGDLGRRRSVYRFLFRSLPDPFMESLDCPSGDQMIPSRSNSVTVQQALALWNDVFITQHCEHIADRIENDVKFRRTTTPQTDETANWAIERAFQLILERNPSKTELEDVSPFIARHGLANLCRLLLNSNEFLFVN